MHFGKTLKLLRTDAGLSLRALAGQVGVSSAYLSRVENGRDPAPTPDRLNAIAEALDLSPDMLVDLAHQTGAALSSYLDRVPAANSFFLEVARRDLDASQLARLRELMDREFPRDNGRHAGPRPSELIGRRILLDADCRSMEEVIETASELCVDEPALRRRVAERIREREALTPTALGKGVAIPHAVVEGVPTTAALIALAEPLPVESLDGSPVELAVVLISAQSGHDHLQALARIARLVNNGLARQLRRADNLAAARAAIERMETM